MKDDQALRPSHLDDYIGQDHIKEPLKAALASSKARKVPLPHVLLAGPPGLGKTTLSLIIANTMGWKMVDLIGSTAGRPLELTDKILYFNEPTIFFIDEIHALRGPTQEVLYPVLEDGKLLYPSVLGTRTVEIQPLTVIGATTHLGKLNQPFIDRFQLQFTLRFYEVDELMELGAISAKKLGLTLDEDSLVVVAERSRGTPRYTNNYLKWIRDFALYQGTTTINLDFTKQVLWGKLKIDDRGLTALDRHYLRALATFTTPVGLESVAAQLRQQEVTLENTVEPYLLESGLIERIRNGRRITDLGRSHLASFRRKK